MSGQFVLKGSAAEGFVQVFRVDECIAVVSYDRENNDLDIKTALGVTYLPMYEILKRLNFPEKVLLYILLDMLALTDYLDELHIADRENETYLPLIKRVKLAIDGETLEEI